jgi:hypothetical protein
VPDRAGRGAGGWEVPAYILNSPFDRQLVRERFLDRMLFDGHNGESIC